MCACIYIQKYDDNLMDLHSKKTITEVTTIFGSKPPPIPGDRNWPLPPFFVSGNSLYIESAWATADFQVLWLLYNCIVKQNSKTLDSNMFFCLFMFQLKWNILQFSFNCPTCTRCTGSAISRGAHAAHTPHTTHAAHHLHGGLAMCPHGQNTVHECIWCIYACSVGISQYLTIIRNSW